MNYQEARPKIKSGDLLAWTIRTTRSLKDLQVQLVRIFTKSEYTHVGIAYVVGGRLFVLESVGSGIRMFPLSMSTPFYWIPLEVNWTEDTLTAALSKMGESYSKWEGVKSLWQKIKPGENKNWQCAEYARFILQNAGINVDCRSIPAEVVYWVQENLDATIHMVTSNDVLSN